MEETKENQFKRGIIKAGIVFLGIIFIFTILAKTIYTFLLPRVSVEKVSSGKIETKILTEGKIGYDKLTIDAKEVAVKMPTDGEILACYVGEDQIVKKGEPLFKIKKVIDEEAVDAKAQQKAESAINQSSFKREKAEEENKQATLREKLQEAQKKLASQEKSYEVSHLEAQIESKEEEVKVDCDLYQTGAISESDYNSVVNELLLLKKQKESQIESEQEKIQSNIDEINERLQDVESQIAMLDEKIALEDTKLCNKESVKSEEIIMSPIAGSVYELDVAVGAGMLKNDSLLIIVPNDIPITLSFNVSDKQEDKVKMEQTVSWTNDQEREKASVMKKKYEEETGQTSVICKVDEKLAKSLVDHYKDYKEVDVEVINTSDRYDLLVPSSAIVMEGPKAYVYTIEKIDGLLEMTYIAHKNAVSIIKKGDEMTAISGALDAQSEVIKMTNKVLHEGDEVSKS